MQYTELSQQLVQRCLSKGAGEAEVFLQDGRNLTVRVRNGEVELVQESQSAGVGFRIYVNGAMAFSHCNNLSDASIDGAIDSAITFAKSMTPDENNVLPEDAGISAVEGLYDPAFASVSMDAKIGLAKKVEELALADERIQKSGGASYRDGIGSTYVANSNGLAKEYQETFFGYSVYVVSENEKEKSSGGEGSSKRFFADLDAPEEVAAEAAKSAYEMMDATVVKTQRAPVIFHPDVSRSILGGIARAINGEQVLQGASFLRDKMDEKIAVSGFTVIDDGIRHKGLASSPFDGEGVPTQRRVIIDRGVLKGFIYNTFAAKRAGVQSTGNASRGSFTSIPGIGTHSFYMSNGRTSPERMISRTSNGLYLKSVTGYGINPVAGNFSGGAKGFWIENGKIAFPVKDLTIAGNAFDMLNGIDYIGNDLDLDKNRRAPHFRIGEMQIGGE